MFLTICIILGFLILVITARSSPTSPKGTLTALIKIEGLTDYSGITVTMYNLATIDTTMARINTEHPGIGVIATQETEFDFHFHDASQGSSLYNQQQCGFL